jgi:DNA-binding MarR family transcriptional regulator/L-amino acid N-acyltransferase YncA
MSDAHVARVRQFNRFYTRQIGVLNEGLLDSPYSLTELRVLYELAHGRSTTATALRTALGLDAGYTSRLLRGFERGGLLRRVRSAEDRREAHIELTPRGRTEFAALNRRQERQVAGLLRPLAAAHRQRLVRAMSQIEELLEHRDEGAPRLAWRLRRDRPGDMGWVVHRHGVLYAQEYGWDARFEALVARIAADFVDKGDPLRERCWIAEADDQIVGCVFVVKYTEDTAKLRLLLVEPHARGSGLGRALVARCIRFARKSGYKRMTLWTQSNLSAARRIYDRAGFRITASEPNESFGHRLVSETWELDL